MTTTISQRDLDIAWLAGLYEGEGSLTNPPDSRGKHYARMYLSMTDEDVVRRAHEIAGVGQVNGPYMHHRGTKPYWQWGIQRRAHVIQFMQMIYPYLGDRRRAKVDEVFPDLFGGRR